MISTFAVPGQTPRVRIVVAADGSIEESAANVANGIAWNLKVKGVKTEAVAVQPRAGALRPRRPATPRLAPPARADLHRPEGLLRVQGHRHPQPAARHRRGLQAQHHRLRRREGQDHHPPAQRALGSGPGHHPEDQGARQGDHRQHHPGGAAARRSRRSARLPEASARALAKREPLKVRIIPVNYATGQRGERQGEGSAHRARQHHRRSAHQHAHRQGHPLGWPRRGPGAQARHPDAAGADRGAHRRGASNFTREVGIQWGGHPSATSALGNPPAWRSREAAASAPSAAPSARGFGGTSPRRTSRSTSRPPSAQTRAAASASSSARPAARAAQPAPHARWRTRACSRPSPRRRSPPSTTRTAIIGQGISIPFSPGVGGRREHRLRRGQARAAR